MAKTAFVPIGREETVRVAWPALLTGALPMAKPAPGLICTANPTEPVGVPVAPVTTVAVSVTVCPELDGFGLEMRDTVVSDSLPAAKCTAIWVGVNVAP